VYSICHSFSLCRRLLYVGMTRAQVLLYITLCEARWMNGTSQRRAACERVYAAGKLTPSCTGANAASPPSPFLSAMLASATTRRFAYDDGYGDDGGDGEAGPAHAARRQPERNWTHVAPHLSVDVLCAMDRVLHRCVAHTRLP
jgi:ATP-dependent exoDNAse (exonuclease V) beta subunit